MTFYSWSFQFVENGRLQGFNIEVMNKLAQEQNMQIQYIQMTEKQAIESIQDGTIDILIGIPFTEQYSREMRFSDSFMTSSIGVLVPKNSEVKNISDLQNKVVALQYNSIEYDFIRNIRRVDVHIAYDQTTTLDIIKHGRSDALLGNAMTIEYLLDEYNIRDEYEMIENYLLPLEYSFVVAKDNYALLNKLNTGIRQLKLSNGYTKIYSKWFGEIETPLHKQIEKIRDALIIIILIAAFIFIIVMRWNRALKKQVAAKTEDLQEVNASLKAQVCKTIESNQLKDQILESSLRGVITVSNEGVILTINTVATKLFRVDHTVIGSHIKDVFFNWEKFSNEIKQVIEGGTNYKDQAYDVTAYFEDMEYISYDIQPIYNVTGDVIGALLYFEDVTEEKKLKEQWYDQDKNRALIQLVTGIAHEIRNPLTSIKTFVEIMPHKMHSEKFREAISHHVPKEIDRLNQLIEELINYAKPKSDNKVEIDLSAVIDFIVILFGNPIQEKGYRFITEIEKNIWIKGDENQLKQVLINLLLNAIESNDRKKSTNNNDLAITIRLYKREEAAHIDIIDEGIGMDAAMQKQIFEPFYTTKSDGTGLGLALTRQFVIENNGMIQIESKVNQFSIFKLVFPLEEVKYG